MSDFIPNSYQTPNAYVDKLMAFLTPSEWLVLSYMSRRIFGFNKRKDRIALSQLERGTRDKEGNQLDYGTGLGREANIKALAGLKKYNLVVEVAKNNPKVNKGACYSLQLDFAKVDVAGLKARKEDGRNEGKRQTARAREEREILLALVKAETAPHTVKQTGGSDVQQTAPHTVKQTHNNQLEKQGKHTLRANDARAEPPQAMLFDDSATVVAQKPKPPEKQSTPKAPPDTQRMTEYIVLEWGVDSYARAGNIVKALQGRLPKGHTHRAYNLSPPVTFEELEEFTTDYYPKACKGCSFPRSPEKIQDHFYSMRRERTHSDIPPGYIRTGTGLQEVCW